MTAEDPSEGERLDAAEDAAKHAAKPRGLHGQRPSHSHDEFVQKEFTRVAAMTPRERMLEALSLEEDLEPILSPRRRKAGSEEASK